jgi:hypothetical protein
MTEDQGRVHRPRQIHHHLLVDLDIERADYRADAPDAEPDEKFLQAFVRQQQDTVAFLDAPRLKKSGDVRRDRIKLPEGDRRTAIEIDDGGPFGIARPILRKQLGNRLIRNAEFVISENACHGALR